MCPIAATVSFFHYVLHISLLIIVCCHFSLHGFFLFILYFCWFLAALTFALEPRDFTENKFLFLHTVLLLSLLLDVFQEKDETLHLWYHVHTGNGSWHTGLSRLRFITHSRFYFSRHLFLFIVFCCYCFTFLCDNLFKCILLIWQQLIPNSLTQIQNQFEILCKMTIWDFAIFFPLRYQKYTWASELLCFNLILNDITFSTLLPKIEFYFIYLRIKEGRDQISI